MQNKLSLKTPQTDRHKAPLYLLRTTRHNTETAMRKLVDKEYHEQ